MSVDPPRAGWSAWPWFAAGGVLTAALLGVAWRRRRRSLLLPDAAPAPAAAPVKPIEAEPAKVADTRAAALAAHVAAGQVRFTEAELLFELVLEITNSQPHAVEGVRPALALISAHPDQDRHIAAFHAGSIGMGPSQPFDLPPGGSVRLPVRLGLARDRLHVVDVRGRPMMVGLLLLDLRWRAGLSIRRTGADFLLGSAGAGPRPGPIWLDRPPPAALAAIAYVPSGP